jgi:hypothetical protein
MSATHLLHDLRAVLYRYDIDIMRRSCVRWVHYGGEFLPVARVFSSANDADNMPHLRG